MSIERKNNFLQCTFAQSGAIYSPCAVLLIALDTYIAESYNFETFYSCIGKILDSG
jgi:hypothetical protein